MLADAVYRVRQGLRVVPRDNGRTVVIRPNSVYRDPAELSTAHMHAVVGVGSRDDLLPVRLPDHVPVATHQFDRRVHGVTAAAGEKHLGVWHRCHLDQAISEVDGGSRGEIAEVGISRDLGHLPGHGFADLGASMSDVAVPETRGGIEVVAAILAAHSAAVSASDNETIPCHCGHVGEGMPDVRTHS